MEDVDRYFCVSVIRNEEARVVTFKNLGKNDVAIGYIPDGCRKIRDLLFLPAGELHIFDEKLVGHIDLSILIYRMARRD